MKLITTPKAKKLISTLNKNEKSMLEYVTDLIKQDNDHIQKCEKEKYFHDDKERFNKAISHQLNMIFRAKYIIQILGIYISDDLETQTITLKVREDK
jgi:hypothetical protein